MVSTDDNEIAELSIKFGANVPFLRSVKNSSDFSTTADAIYEVLNCMIMVWTGVQNDRQIVCERSLASFPALRYRYRELV